MCPIAPIKICHRSSFRNSARSRFTIPLATFTPTMSIMIVSTMPIISAETMQLSPLQGSPKNPTTKTVEHLKTSSSNSKECPAHSTRSRTSMRGLPPGTKSTRQPPSTKKPTLPLPTPLAAILIIPPLTGKLMRLTTMASTGTTIKMLIAVVIMNTTRATILIMILRKESMPPHINTSPRKSTVSTLAMT